MTATEEMQLAALAFEAIAKIIESVLSAKSGAISPATALAGITAIHDVLASNNAEIDSEALTRFALPPKE